MHIRQADSEDAPEIARLLMLAMKDIIFELIGSTSLKKALAFLTSLVEQKNTQYSYEFCQLAIERDHIIGVILCYDGGRLEELRKPVEKYLYALFGKRYQLADETSAGEWYIDCIGVDPAFQGRGVGSQLLNNLIQEHVCKRHQTLGLLVDTANPSAQRLYEKVGFRCVGQKVLFGKTHFHLQIKKALNG